MVSLNLDSYSTRNLRLILFMILMYVHSLTLWWGRYNLFLAVSCPYSRAEHIPCQNGWEISGNRADPVQVNFLFRTVCQVFLFFWHVRCRLHVFFPREDPSFEQFLMMAFSWKWSLIRTFRTNWIWEVRWTILFSSLQYIFPRKEYDAIPGVR